MKSERVLLSTFAFLLTGLSYIYSQDKDDPLTKSAFDKNIMQDINFMVLGENNPKQGFSYEYAEKKTELSLSGALYNFKPLLVTIDGSFAVDDATYIFDNKDGSKKGKLSLNVFFPWGCNYKNYPPEDDQTTTENNNTSKKTKRAEMLNSNAKKVFPKNAMDNFTILDAILKKFNLPGYSTADIEKGELFVGLEKTVPDETVLYSALVKYYKNNNKGPVPTTYNELAAKINSSKKTAGTKASGEKISRDQKIKTDESLSEDNVPTELDIDKLFTDYEAAISRLENIEEEVNDYQINTFKNIWTYEFNNYLGISPYYEREGLDIYNGLKTVFSERFIDTKGDLYGVNLNLNQVWRYKKGLFFFIRELITLGRGSNFKDFKKKEYVFSTLPETIDNGTVIEEQKKTGYYETNGLPYQYGFLQKYGAELFLSYNVIGFYGRFGYTKNEAKFKKESLPLETGILINVKSEKKNVVSILLFVAREDLKVHPDLDTNFGFKIGLPINIKKYEKEKVEEKAK